MLDLTYTTAVVSGFICKALRSASKANFSKYNCTPWERKQVPINILCAFYSCTDILVVILISSKTIVWNRVRSTEKLCTMYLICVDSTLIEQLLILCQMLLL